MHILITAGGTREYIDPVRFISNASTGKMGYALARASIKAGHKVTLITAPTARRPPDEAEIVRVETAAEMFEAVKQDFHRCDCLIMAAAVADYIPVRPSKTKLKKTDQHLTIKLKPTPDILRWAGMQKNKRSPHSRGQACPCRSRGTKQGRRIIVGFALEDKAIRARAEEKLHEKNLDMIVANYPAAIGADRSDVHIKTTDTPWIIIQNATKATIARKIIFHVEKICGT